MTPNIENNPLNTGNGAPQESNPITPVIAQAAPAPKPVATPVTPTPMPPTASTPATPTQQQVATATTAQTSAKNIVSGTSKVLQFKKYIIAGIVGIIFLTIIYVAYSFFSSPNDGIATEENPTTEVELNNSLSSSSSTDSSESTNPEDTAELEKVVNDLKDQYKDDNSNSPGISIVIPETTETDTSTPTDTDTTPPSDSGSDTTPPTDSESDTTPPADSESDTTPPADSKSDTTPPADSEEVAR